jgi:glycosyltransferase involved in cell wall biosynthesis
MLLKAVALLRVHRPNVRLTVAGPGDPKYVAYLKELAQQLELGEAAEFPGLVAGSAKAELFAAADVFALPTHQENFGRVLYEALLCGTPIVTTKGADTWRELEASGGAVITERQPESIADALASLLADPVRCTSMGASGRRWAQAELDPETLGRRYELLYESTFAR